MAMQALPEMFRPGTASLEYVGKSQGANSDGTGDCITHAIDTARSSTSLQDQTSS